MTGLTNEVVHTFQLRAVNADGESTAAEAGPVTPTPGICGRTPQVRDEILNALSGVDDCAAVTVADLATVTELYIVGQNVTALQSGDFAGLSAVGEIQLRRNALTDASVRTCSPGCRRWGCSFCPTTRSRRFPRACFPDCRRWRTSV